MTAAILDFARQALAHGVRRLSVIGAAEATTRVLLHMNRVNHGVPAATRQGKPITVQVEAVDGPFAGSTIATGTPREMHIWLQANGFRPARALAAHTQPVTAGAWVKESVQ